MYKAHWCSPVGQATSQSARTHIQHIAVVVERNKQDNASRKANSWHDQCTIEQAKLICELCTQAGERRWLPLSLPFMEGMTRATALAAPVVVGTMLRAAALARRKSRWEASKSLWSPVYEWVVVIVPFTMPNLSSNTCTSQNA